MYNRFLCNSKHASHLYDWDKFLKAGPLSQVGLTFALGIWRAVFPEWLTLLLTAVIEDWAGLGEGMGNLRRESPRLDCQLRVFILPSPWSLVWACSPTGFHSIRAWEGLSDPSFLESAGIREPSAIEPALAWPQSWTFTLPRTQGPLYGKVQSWEDPSA